MITYNNIYDPYHIPLDTILPNQLNITKDTNYKIYIGFLF